ncbi:hypothetical protein VE23_15625 [Paenibacillus sp. D9]|nr:hypothetical protein VE23_15625 [Paenibacillus sp. D9]
MQKNRAARPADCRKPCSVRSSSASPVPVLPFSRRAKARLRERKNPNRTCRIDPLRPSHR